MPGFRLTRPDGSQLRCTARIRPFVTHEESRPNYDGKAEFELTEMSFQTSIGTYLDSPYVRFRDRRDIGELLIEELVLPGVVVDLRHLKAGEAAGVADLRAGIASGFAIAGHGVLCRFGWDRFWGEEAYFSYPFLSRDGLQWLIDGGARLVGVDTINIDSRRDPERPAHSWLLSRDIFVIENLCGLAALDGGPFRLFAVPIKARGAASMPIRAFAEIA